jgi:hypothetical protein
MTLPSEDELAKIIEERFNEFLMFYVKQHNVAPSTAARQFLLRFFCAGVDLGVELCSKSYSPVQQTKH